MRDGTTIYVDVFRPVSHPAPLPAIVAWSPYGKRGSTHNLDDFPARAGVPRSSTSGLEKFEGPDPAEWCAHGYAVIHPDPRGVGKSKGDIAFCGRQEGQDGHDLVEWIAAQPWSNGKVDLSGNSWLALSQWFIAAERPPHLAAIAPWEGAADLYRQTLCEGGIPSPEFTEWVLGALVGTGRVEDPTCMLSQQPHWGPFWQDKQAHFDLVDVPAYVVASWTNSLHVAGTFQAWHGITSALKWLRVHETHEWVDYYDPAHVAELRRFFDRYLKGDTNGWERYAPCADGSARPWSCGVGEAGRSRLPASKDLFVHLRKLDAHGRMQPISVIPLRNPLLRAFSLNTTMIYARADLDLQRQALMQVFPEALVSVAAGKVALQRLDIVDWLRRL